MSTFTIRTDVPLPKAARGPSTKYPFAELGVGHSFYVPRLPDAPGDLKLGLQRMQRACGVANKQHAPARFAARIEGDGVGVWRTA